MHMNTRESAYRINGKTRTHAEGLAYPLSRVHAQLALALGGCERKIVQQRRHDGRHRVHIACRCRLM